MLLKRQQYAVTLLLVSFLLASTHACLSQTSVLRGPYLQCGSCTSVVVRWRTDVATDSQVVYGLTPSVLEWTNGSSALVTEHELQITGLTPNTKYFYAFGSSTELLGSGQSLYFVTAPQTAKPTRIWVIGDTQGNSDPGLPIEIVRDAYYTYAGGPHADVCLFLGDNSFYGGDDEFQYMKFDVYSELLKNTVSWSSIGNHETNTPIVPNYPYLDAVTLPTNGEAGGVASGSELYYSFDYGNIHFVCLDSFAVPTTNNPEMYHWLERDLAANHKDWLIGFCHAPPYSDDYWHNSDNANNCPEQVALHEIYVPLLESYGLDMILSGHSHTYERTFLIDGCYGYSTNVGLVGRIVDAGRGQLENGGAYIKPTPGLAGREGAVYVVAGTAGSLRCDFQGSPLLCQWDCENGTFVIDVDGLTLNATFLTGLGTVGDHFTIQKGIRFSSVRLENGRVALTWPGMGGYSYRIYRRGTLDEDWSPESEDLPYTAKAMQWEGAVSGDSAFYKLEVIRN